MWDEIRRLNEDLEPDAEELAYVDQRMKDIEKAPNDWLTWDDILQNIKKRKNAQR